MTFSVSFKVINPDFDQDYADEYHNGEESENNLKHSWERSFKVQGNVTEITLKDLAIFPLTGRSNDVEFRYDIPDMQVIECRTEDGSKTIFAASNELIQNTHKAQNKKNKLTHYYFYLKKNEREFIDLNGILISKGHFPTDLLRK